MIISLANQGLKKCKKEKYDFCFQDHLTFYL